MPMFIIALSRSTNDISEVERRVRVSAPSLQAVRAYISTFCCIPIEHSGECQIRLCFVLSTTRKLMASMGELDENTFHFLILENSQSECTNSKILREYCRMFSRGTYDSQYLRARMDTLHERSATRNPINYAFRPSHRSNMT